jgi:hypothetical protein
MANENVSVSRTGRCQQQRSEEPELIQATANPGGGDASNSKRWFKLDAVFDQFSTQQEVYERSGTRQAVCEDLFRGYNATILAYGQTGAGKTHTMGSAVRQCEGQGKIGVHVSEDDGIIPRACVDLFRNVQDKCDGNARVDLSYLEIYNEEIRDLLATASGDTTSHDLKIRETLHGEVYVSGLTEREVLSTEHVGQLMEEASKRRVVASTAMNATSSRSHAICTLRISGVVQDENIESRSERMDKFTAKLTLVDLAGSERIKKTNAQGNRRQEGIR